MEDSRTLTVRVKKDKGGYTTRHFNVDNLTYLQFAVGSLTPYAIGVIVGTAAVTALALLILFGDLLVALIVGGLIWYLLLAMLSTEYRIRIGTVNDSYGFDGSSSDSAGDSNELIESNDTSSLEQRFKEKSRDFIFVEKGSESDINGQSTYATLDYRYYFVPDNVVSMEHGPYSIIPIPYFLYIIAIISLVVGFQFNNQIWGILFGSIFGIAGYYLDHHRIPPKLIVNFHGGERKEFRLDSEDLEYVLTEYKNRSDSEASDASHGSS